MVILLVRPKVLIFHVHDNQIQKMLNLIIKLDEENVFQMDNLNENFDSNLIVILFD